MLHWEARTIDGRVTHPFGPDARGYLAYTADGYMFGVLSRADRPPFSDADLFGGAPDEWAAAGRGYVAYCGRFDVTGDTVVHHVELSLFPNWIGRDQVRFAALEGDHLTLTTPPLLAGGESVHRLV